MNSRQIFQYDRERVIIIGAGNGAEVVIDILLDDDKIIAGLVDDSVKKMENYKYPILKCGIHDFAECIDQASYDTVIISIGSTFKSMKLRGQIFEEYKKKGINFTNAVSKSAEIRRGVNMGTGNLIGAGSYIGTMTQIGDNNSINYGTYIGHHNKIGNHNLLAPGMITSGSVMIGSNCVFLAGVAIRNRVTIGDQVTVPVGYAVTDSIADHTVIRWNDIGQVSRKNMS